MTTPTLDLSVRPVVDILVACLEQAVATVPKPPKVTCLRPGEQVALMLSSAGRDECCEGLAWVRVASIYPSNTFPAQDITVAGCGVVAWAATIELGVARCAPTPPAEEIPSCEEWTDATYAILDDAAAMRRALCCFAAAEKYRLMLPGIWTPLPIDGGCMGGTMLVTVAIGDCDCVEAS